MIVCVSLTRGLCASASCACARASLLTQMENIPPHASECHADELSGQNPKRPVESVTTLSPTPPRIAPIAAKKVVAAPAAAAASSSAAAAASSATKAVKPKVSLTGKTMAAAIVKPPEQKKASASSAPQRPAATASAVAAAASTSVSDVRAEFSANLERVLKAFHGAMRKFDDSVSGLDAAQKHDALRWLDAKRLAFIGAMCGPLPPKT